MSHARQARAAKGKQEESPEVRRTPKPIGLEASRAQSPPGTAGHRRDPWFSPPGTAASRFPAAPPPQPEKRGAREGSSREVVNPGPLRERSGHLGAIGRAAGGGQAPLQHHEQLRPARPDGAAARRLRGCRLHLGLPAAAGNGGAAREWEHEGCSGGGRERRP